MVASPSPSPSPQNAVAANAAARQAVLAASVNMLQSTYTTQLTSGVPGTVLNVPLRNVGLLKRIWIEISVKYGPSAAETQSITKFGPANILSQVVLTDLSNNIRVQTPGWHLHMLACARRRRAFGAAVTTDTPVAIGSNFNVIKAPSSISSGPSSPNIFMVYEVPVAYSDRDLRGALWTNVVNATYQLQMTINSNFSVGSGAADNTLAVYKSSTAGDLGTISQFNVTVYQEYLDQLPMSSAGPVLPLLDLSTAYLLTNTALTGLSAAQDFPIPYANFRQFLSTFVVYDNAGTLNAGSDINYFSLQAANYTNIWKYDPQMAALFARDVINDDFPVGTYYFDHRSKPINTQQYGNQQLIVNPSSVGGSTAQTLVGWEALAFINQVVQAGSLYGS